MKHFNTALVLLCLTTGGCLSLAKQPPETTRYVLDVRRDAGETGNRSGPRIEVRSFHSSASFGGRKLVYRTGEHEVESDYYHELVVPPAVAVSEATRAWLSASERFTTAHAGSSVSPDWTIEGDLVTMHGDYRGEPRAVVGIHVTVVARDGSRIVLDELFEHAEPMASEGPAELVAAWNRALGAILTRLETSLATAAS